MRISKLLFGILIATTLCATSAFADSVTIDFATIQNANVATNGNYTFQFNNVATGLTAGYSFQVTSPGSSSGLYGQITTSCVGCSAFTISNTPALTNTSTSAAVTGSGLFEIFDGTTWMTGAIDWVDIGHQGTGDDLNVNGVLNLSTIQYSGTNADLLTLKNIGVGSVSVTLQFTSTDSLLYLATHRVSTSFSGSVYAATPEPDSLLMLGIGLSALVFVGRRRTLFNG